MKTYSTMSKKSVVITTDCPIKVCELLDSGFKRVQQVQVESKSIAKSIWAVKCKEQTLQSQKGNLNGVVASILTLGAIIFSM
ncbi:MAG: hypothetical protein V7782_13145 [Psychromonas sp.]